MGRTRPPTILAFFLALMLVPFSLSTAGAAPLAQTDQPDKPLITAIGGIADNAVVKGTATIAVTAPTANEVVFFLQAPNGTSTKYLEQYPPFFFGGDKAGKPTGWNTTSGPDGAYTLEITARTTAGFRDVRVIRFHVRNQETTTAVRVLALDGISDSTTVSGRVAITAQVDGPVKQVVFTITNKEGTEVTRATERYAPYALGGDDGSTAYGWNSADLANGSYTLTVTAQDATGDSDTLTRTFTIDNGTTSAPGQNGQPATRKACTGLQAMLDTAKSGSTVTLDAGCVYREQVTVRKQLTLNGNGAQIRGSDVWTGWSTSGDRYVSQKKVPAFNHKAQCAGSPRCGWPEQVYLDGAALTQVASNPKAGEFARLGDNRILLGSGMNPAGHTVEVTTRTSWMKIAADGVVIKGMVMLHAGNTAQQGALDLGGRSNVTIQANTLAYAHGGNVKLGGGRANKLVGNDIHNGGQLGVHAGSIGVDVQVIGNKIHNNNTEFWSIEWEAGGFKATRATRLLLQDNEAYNNHGPGLWCDIDCKSITMTGNNVHHNGYSGIWFEISDNATITGNRAWENGYFKAGWGWGAGILIASSRGATVENNTVAWNADGITVVSQNRKDNRWDNVYGNTVRSNSIVQAGNGYALAFLDDHGGPTFKSGNKNIGIGNQVWLSDTSSARFAWGGKSYTTLTSYSATPGGQQICALSLAQQKQTLTTARLPLQRMPTYTES